MTRDYEYGGLMAQTWDLFRGDTSTWSDRFLFLDLIGEFGQPVLDVGCGTGRLLLDYVQQGIAIDGVDNSPEMLELCRQKAAALDLNLTLFQQDMEMLLMPRRYRTILVPSSSFQLVTDPADARQVMERLVVHLQPGGALVMPFMEFWRAGDPLHTEWELQREATRPEDGAVFRRWSRADYDPAHQWEHTEDRYEMIVDGQVVAEEHHRRSPATRWYTQGEAVQLYQDAGLTDIRVLKEFTHDPADATDTLFTVIGTRS